MLPFLLTPATVIVKMLFAYPLYAQLSCTRPPFPAANTKIDPFPSRPCEGKKIFQEFVYKTVFIRLLRGKKRNPRHSYENKKNTNTNADPYVEEKKFFILCLDFCDIFIQIEHTSYNCQKATANREVSNIRVEVG